MSGQFLWGRFIFFTTAIMVGGWGIMKWSTPSEEKFYESLSPDLKKKVDAVRAQREGGGGLRTTLADAGLQEKIVWAEDLSQPPKGRRV